MVVAAGIKGVQLATSIKNAPAMITNMMAVTFSTTIKLLALAAPLVPRISMEITKSTIKKAGRFKNSFIPKISGAPV